MALINMCSDAMLIASFSLVITHSITHLNSTQRYMIKNLVLMIYLISQNTSEFSAT